MPFRKITLVSDVKDQLVKASLDVGRLGKKPLHQCEQEMISSDPGKQQWGEEQAIEVGEEMRASFSAP